MTPSPRPCGAAATRPPARSSCMTVSTATRRSSSGCSRTCSRPTPHELRVTKINDTERLFEPLIALLRSEFGDELLGVLATGSRIHGTPGPTSDLDAHVLIAAPRR